MHHIFDNFMTSDYRFKKKRKKNLFDWVIVLFTVIIIVKMLLSGSINFFDEKSDIVSQTVDEMAHEYEE